MSPALQVAKKAKGRTSDNMSIVSQIFSVSGCLSQVKLLKYKMSQVIITHDLSL